jgi:hypothetical protein
MRILVAIDLNDDDLTAAYDADPRQTFIDHDDLLASLDARFDEFYCGRANSPVRGALVAACDVTDVLPEFIAATEVGAEGIDDADKRDHIFGSLTTFEQHLNA